MIGVHFLDQVLTSSTLSENPRPHEHFLDTLFEIVVGKRLFIYKSDLLEYS